MKDYLGDSRGKMYLSFSSYSSWMRLLHNSNFHSKKNTIKVKKSITYGLLYFAGYVIFGESNHKQKRQTSVAVVDYKLLVRKSCVCVCVYRNCIIWLHQYRPWIPEYIVRTLNLFEFMIYYISWSTLLHWKELLRI